MLLLDAASLEVYRFWAVGSVAGRGFDVIAVVAPFLLVGAVVAIGCARALDSMALGDDVARSLGQKVALARAFMREDADILILDEPTAALDAEAEHAVFERFRTLAKGRTAILISHRFPTVRMADRIIVLEGGQVVEEGTHAELIEAGNRYARLFALQAQGYL